MDCPNKNTIQDFVDGELSEEQFQPLIDHVRSCEVCKTELRELMSLHHILNQAVSADECPSLDTLESYAACGQAEEKDSAITEHMEFCDSCRSYAWAFSASPEDLANWQAQQQRAFDEFQAKEFGYDVAQAALQTLMPAKIELLERMWQSTLAFIQDLKEKAIESWPTFGAGAHLVGALGFAEDYDPENDAASVILVTTLYVSQEVNDGQVPPCQKDIEAAVKQVAAKLGAGKELQKRLLATVPPLVLKFR